MKEAGLGFGRLRYGRDLKSFNVQEAKIELIDALYIDRVTQNRRKL